MNNVFTIAMVLVGMVVLILIIGWLGFQIEPEGFSPHPEKTQDAGAINVPTNIPEPVKRYFRAAAGSNVPEVKSAVGGYCIPCNCRSSYLMDRRKILCR
jgi:hypothetical protein